MTEETKEIQSTQDSQDKQYKVDIVIDKKMRIVDDTHGFEILVYSKIIPKERNGVKADPYWEWKNDGYFGSIYQAIIGAYHKKVNDATSADLKELRDHILSVEKEFKDLFGLDIVVDDKKVDKLNKGKKK